MLRRFAIALSVVALASADHNATTPHPVPVALTAVTSLSDTVIVGAVAGPVTVRVTDAADAPVAGAIVRFVVSLGGQRVFSSSVLGE